METSTPDLPCVRLDQRRLAPPANLPLERFEKIAGDLKKAVWKYIPFEHNSAPGQLLEAQRMADAIGVDELVFVFTRNGPRSTTITHPADIPRLPGLRTPCPTATTPPTRTTWKRGGAKQKR